MYLYLQQNQIDTGSSDWALVASQGIKDITIDTYGYIASMRLVDLAGTETLVAVAEFSNPTTGSTPLGVTFIKIILPTTITVAPTNNLALDYEVAGKAFTARAVYAISANQLQALLFDTASKTMTYVVVDYTTNQLTYREMMTDPSLLVQSGTFTGVNQGFIVGQVS